MGTSERRERERSELRQKILDAARELFVTHGYEAVSMRKVAERIEYSATAIYSHFPDKAAVLQALCDTDFSALALEFVSIAAEPDPVERLRKSGVAYLRFAASHPHQYRLMFMTPLPATEPSESACEKGNPSEDAYAFLRSIVSELLEKQRLLPALQDIELVSQALWCSLHGVAALYAVRERKDKWVDLREPEQVGELIMTSLLRGMLRDGVTQTYSAATHAQSSARAEDSKPQPKRPNKQKKR